MLFVRLATSPQDLPFASYTWSLPATLIVEFNSLNSLYLHTLRRIDPRTHISSSHDASLLHGNYLALCLLKNVW
jgi:hypothetical protein